MFICVLVIYDALLLSTFFILRPKKKRKKKKEKKRITSCFSICTLIDYPHQKVIKYPRRERKNKKSATCIFTSFSQMHKLQCVLWFLPPGENKLVKAHNSTVDQFSYFQQHFLIIGDKFNEKKINEIVFILLS